MATPWQKYRFSKEWDKEQIEQLDEMLEDIYMFLSASPLGTTDDDFDISALGFSTPGVLYATASSVSSLPAGTTGQLLRQGTTDPEWSAIKYPNALAVGDVLYADTTTNLARLAGVATGNALISGGVNTAPSWGKIALTTHVSGTLPIANGGTNKTSYTSGSIIYFDGTSLTQDNSNLFYDASNVRFGFKTSSPTYTGDVRLGTTHSSNQGQWRISANSATEGMFLIGYNESSFHSFSLYHNASFNGTNYIARHTSSSMIHFDTGTIGFYADSGLTGGNSFTPTLRGRIYPSGGVQFLGTLSDPGSGVFKIGGSLTLTTALTVGNGGTGTATAFTAGSVVFAGASGVYSQNNAKLFWDDSNGRLGIGTATPGRALDLLAASGTISIGFTAGSGGNCTFTAIPASSSNGYDVNNNTVGSATRFFTSASSSGDTESARFTTLGVGIGGPTMPTGGTKMLIFAQGTAASGLGSNTAGLQAKDVAGTAEMFAFDENATATQISPHNFTLFDPDPSEPAPWDYYSVNEYLGVEIGVNLTRAIRLVEQMSGEKLIHVRSLPTKRNWYDDQAATAARMQAAYQAWESHKDISDDAPPPLPAVKEPSKWLKERLVAAGDLDTAQLSTLKSSVETWRRTKETSNVESISKK